MPPKRHPAAVNKVMARPTAALRHGAWLSLAHNATGDLDLAVSTARVALGRLPAVSSVLLSRLHDELAPPHRAHQRSATSSANFVSCRGHHPHVNHLERSRMPPARGITGAHSPGPIVLAFARCLTSRRKHAAHFLGQADVRRRIAHA